MSKQDYSKMSKTDLLAIVAQRDPEQHAAMLANGRKTTKAIITAWLEADDNAGRTMSATLSKYRVGYQDVVSYSNRMSKNNGDEIAGILAGLSPEQVMALAERTLGMPKGELVSKYEHLNPGQQRMNSGNRIRAAAKRGEIVAADVKKALKKAA